MRGEVQSWEVSEAPSEVWRIVGALCAGTTGPVPKTLQESRDPAFQALLWAWLAEPCCLGLSPTLLLAQVVSGTRQGAPSCQRQAVPGAGLARAGVSGRRQWPPRECRQV